ncbi:AraC family transcriptional regulator [Paenibacillus qinlingensis]|uniref:AraC-like DNA-binding protein/mannose-6-phosphate isomerase-like protein (Cupin superfamily) n=1 Tax=Paenibacillus qinlingensis TaxID=1837343 RepID=A0ABU1NTI8_9BACL|nr:AraC family transcriptional regulator [Paenibacillus qinlingensis]MDR6550795.1 AraC-like DNA-binding protein/mannose-6-phosphate isomerase-like protein (cupin superfamily) [Paenibacillus qinlingensis]
MTANQELKEMTYLPEKQFPINIFHNYSAGERMLYLHWHDHLEIIYLVKGHAVFDIGGSPYDSSPGDLLFIHSGELHSGYSVNNMDVDYYAIVFNKSLFSSDAGDPLYGALILPFLLGQKRFPVKLSSEDGDYGQFEQAVLQIIREFEERKLGYELAVRSYLQLIMTAAVRRNANFEGIAQRDKQLFEDRRRTKSFDLLFPFIREHYARHIALEEAAQMVNMSIHHFCKTFKRLTGRTFVEFVNLHRVNVAEHLLRTTDISVTEAADRVGFGSINYFIRIFKQFKYYSPSQCKK